MAPSPDFVMWTSIFEGAPSASRVGNFGDIPKVGVFGEDEAEDGSPKFVFLGGVPKLVFLGGVPKFVLILGLGGAIFLTGLPGIPGSFLNVPVLGLNWNACWLPWPILFCTFGTLGIPGAPGVPSFSGVPGSF